MIKKLLAGYFLFLALLPSALAMPEGPITEYFPRADTVYLVRITSITKDKVTFPVTEALRGKDIKTLSLVPGAFAFDGQKNSELLILSWAASRNGENGDSVGGEMEGAMGWLYAPAIRDNRNVYVMAFGDPVNGHAVDKTVNSMPYVSLERIKRLLKKNPQKP